MRSLRALVIGAAVAALAITSLGAPAAAAATEKGSVAIVNGMPYSQVDICINGREVRSKLPYGQKAIKSLSAAQKRLKVFKKDPRKCKGRLLFQKRFDLLPDENKTIVLTRKAPRVLVFDDLGPIMGTGTSGRVTLRHAADLGSMRFIADIGAVNPQPWEPSADLTVWDKGDHEYASIPLVPAEFVAMLEVRSRTTGSTFAGPRTIYAARGYDHELIFVGSRRANAKIVALRRAANFEPGP